MPHLLWSKMPPDAAPVGITVTQYGTTWVASGADRAALCEWQRQLLVSGSLQPGDLWGSGEGPYTEPPVEVSAARARALDDLLALDNSQTTGAAIRSAIEAIRGTP